MGTVTPENSPWLALRQLLVWVRPYRIQLFLGMGLTVLAALTEPFIPALMKPLLDHGFKVQDPIALIWIPLSIVLVFVIRGGCNFAASYVMSWVQGKVVQDVRLLLFDHLLHLPSQYFRDTRSSESITRIVLDVNGLSAACTTSLTVLISDTVAVLGLFAWLFYLNWSLTLTVFITIPVLWIVANSVGLRIQKLLVQERQDLTSLTESVQEAVQGHRVIKIFAAEEQEREHFRGLTHSLRGNQLRVGTAGAISTPVTQITAAIGVAIVVALAMLQSAGGEGENTAGSFVSFITALLMLNAPLRRLADVNTPIQRGISATHHVLNFLNEKRENESHGRPLSQVRGHIQLQGVSFRYPNAENDALVDIDLDILPGEEVALVGVSGSGKSTLVSLLPRFHSPTAGRILLDGYALEDIQLSSLRQHIAVVSQEILLFNDTVRNNIAFGATRGSSDEKIIAAAEAAFAWDFISSMPQGLDTPLGEQGVRLSGGERQRIAIARAILKNAPILILDEATSALDNQSEQQLQEALERLMQGRTSLVIAHRLSTIRYASRIVVLHEGRIAEVGTYQELMDKNGLYRRLQDGQPFLSTS